MFATVRYTADLETTVATVLGLFVVAFIIHWLGDDVD